MGRLDGIRYQEEGDRKSTRLNSSHLVISYAVFCLKKKNAFVGLNSVHGRQRLAERPGQAALRARSCRAQKSGRKNRRRKILLSPGNLHFPPLLVQALTPVFVDPLPLPASYTRSFIWFEWGMIRAIRVPVVCAVATQIRAA